MSLSKVIQPQLFSWHVDGREPACLAQRTRHSNLRVRSKMWLGQVNPSKAPESDDISGSYLKLCGGKKIPFLTELFCKIYDKWYFSRCWSRSVIIPIFMSSDRLNPKNCRVISLLSNIGKIFIHFDQSFANSGRRNKFSYEQAGFRGITPQTITWCTLHSIALKTVSILKHRKTPKARERSNIV